MEPELLWGQCHHYLAVTHCPSSEEAPNKLCTSRGWGQGSAVTQDGMGPQEPQ